MNKGLMGCVALVIAGEASAFTGEDLIGWSKAYDQDPKSLRATAFGSYVAGVLDAGDGQKFCLPKTYTYADAMQGVVPYAYQYPVMLKGKASTIIEEYLASKHPCQS